MSLKLKLRVSTKNVTPLIYSNEELTTTTPQASHTDAPEFQPDLKLPADLPQRASTAENRSLMQHTPSSLSL